MLFKKMSFILPFILLTTTIALSKELTHQRLELASTQGPYLLLDDYFVESSRNILRKVNQPKRDPNIPNPILTAKEDCTFQPYFTVLRDPQTNLFRIWYGASTEDRNQIRSRIGYMESQDGIHWQRPARFLKDFGPIQFGCEVIDEGPNFPDQSKRYKYSWYYGGGTRMAFSSDGLNFTPISDEVLVKHNHDVLNVSWDSLRKRYVATMSFDIPGDKWKGNRRITKQSVSTDLFNWSQPTFALTPDDSLDDGETQFYAMATFLNRGPIRIGMVKVLRDDLKADPQPLIEPNAYGIGYTSLAWTYDGVNWIRDREVFFDRNAVPQTWDRSHSWIDEQLIVNNEIYLYYAGYKQGHKAKRFEERQIGLVKMPLDRYVARTTLNNTTGTLLTIPIQLDNQPRKLLINVDAVGGKIRIQFRNAKNNSVIKGLSFDDCLPITTDALQIQPVWKSKEHTAKKLASLAGKAVKIEFELTDTSLYSFDLPFENPY